MKIKHLDAFASAFYHCINDIWLGTNYFNCGSILQNENKTVFLLISDCCIFRSESEDENAQKMEKIFFFDDDCFYYFDAHLLNFPSAVYSALGFSKSFMSISKSFCNKF